MIKTLTKSQISSLHHVLLEDKMLPVDKISVGFNVKYDCYSFYFLHGERIKNFIYDKEKGKLRKNY